MKKIVYLIVSICFVCVTGGQAYAETTTISGNSVSVTGSASVKVAPDRMNWTLTLDNTEPQLTLVAKKQRDSLKKIIRYLKKMGIDDKDIQTDNARFGEKWVRENKVGYFASTAIQFCIYDFTKYEKIWEGLSHFEGLKIGGTQYEIADSAKHRSEMRKQAVLNAKKKALELTEPLGAKVGKPIKISEFEARERYSIAYGVSRQASSSNQNNQMFSLGMIDVSSKVNITFELAN